MSPAGSTLQVENSQKITTSVSAVEASAIQMVRLF